MNRLPFGAAIAARRSGLIAALAVIATAHFAGLERAAADTRLAQADRTSPVTSGAGPVPELQGIGLTASHRRIIYENVAGERVQKLSDDAKPSVGGTVPDSIILNEIPIEVKDQVGLLRDFKFAKLPGDNIVLVDPASRKIVDIITRDAGGR